MPVRGGRSRSIGSRGSRSFGTRSRSSGSFRRVGGSGVKRTSFSGSRMGRSYRTTHRSRAYTSRRRHYGGHYGWYGHRRYRRSPCGFLSVLLFPLIIAVIIMIVLDVDFFWFTFTIFPIGFVVIFILIVFGIIRSFSRRSSQASRYSSQPYTPSSQPYTQQKSRSSSSSFCEYCGAKLKSNDKFCMNCGQKSG